MDRVQALNIQTRGHRKRTLIPDCGGVAEDEAAYDGSDEGELVLVVGQPRHHGTPTLLQTAADGTHRAEYCRVLPLQSHGKSSQHPLGRLANAWSAGSIVEITGMGNRKSILTSSNLKLL